MNESRPNRGPNRPDIYQIILQGQLSPQRSDWFDGFTITLDERGWTILVGPVIDQAGLHGPLKKIRDLGIPLIRQPALSWRVGYELGIQLRGRKHPQGAEAAGGLKRTCPARMMGLKYSMALERETFLVTTD